MSLTTLNTKFYEDTNNSDVFLTKSNSIDDLKMDINWASFIHYLENSRYLFAVAPTVPLGYIYEEDNLFIVEIPIEKLGVQCNLNKHCNGANWKLFGDLIVDGTTHHYDNISETFKEDEDNITNTRSWVKVTKNSGINNFTIEFEMTIYDKKLKGYYSGIFTDYTDN